MEKLGFGLGQTPLSKLNKDKVAVASSWRFGQLQQLEQALKESSGAGSDLNEFNKSALENLIQEGGFGKMLLEKDINDFEESLIGEDGAILSVSSE